MPEKIDNIKDIPKFNYTIGELPTSYLMSMSYQEQLTWLCNYINQTLIVKVNETIAIYNDMVDDFIALNDKVDTALIELDNNLEAGLQALEDEIDRQLGIIREDIVEITTNIVNTAIVNQEITVAMTNTYNADTEELVIGVVGQLADLESERF